MNAALIERPPVPPRKEPIVTTLDDRRGTAGMMLTILTEALLFIMLFFAYFYLAQGTWRWLDQKPPKLHLAIIMLILLLISSGVLYWGEKRLKEGRHGAARAAMGAVILIGLCFLGIQGYEYYNHLQELRPQDSAYGSIFYTITTFHAAHLMVGLIMLAYVLSLPRLEPAPKPPHRPYHNASLYWHFVDVVWVFIVALLYIAPNVR